MSSASPPHDLACAIEALIAAHVEEALRTAQAAIARSFAAGRKAGVGHASPTAAVKRGKKKRTMPAPRRSKEELAQLRQRLHELVRERPGAQMSEFSEVLKVSVRDLNRPMMQLKSQGNVRSAGERNRTQYYPMVGQQ